MKKYRKERDFLGELKVPSQSYYGIQTQRAILNFPAHGEKCLFEYPELIESIVQIKMAAALSNKKSGELTGEISDLIYQAAHVLLDNKMYDQFPIHRFHGGGGTSANMNANEVIANIANEMKGEKPGRYFPVHPNEHVNMNQSTNDVYPSACHLAIIKKWPSLRNLLKKFRKEIDKQAESWRGVKKISRTCLQDAVVINYGDFFSAYSELINRSIQRINLAVRALHKLNVGGTVVGDKSSVSEKYITTFIKEIRVITGVQTLEIGDNLFDSAQNPDDMVNVSLQLSLLARGLIKIAKDIRLMSSGPETGFGEIEIPHVQPGSSIMPGKINPVIPEFLIQSCFQVIGLNEAIQTTVDHGELELNIYESLILYNILDQMDLLLNGVDAFMNKCFSGIAVNIATNNRNTQSSIPLITELMRRKGYKYATEIYKTTNGDPSKIKKYLDE